MINVGQDTYGCFLSFRIVNAVYWGHLEYEGHVYQISMECQRAQTIRAVDAAGKNLGIHGGSRVGVQLHHPVAGWDAGTPPSVSPPSSNAGRDPHGPPIRSQ